jgi:outer membrane protein TolC
MKSISKLYNAMLWFALVCTTYQANAQQKVLTLQDAIRISLSNYKSIQARKDYAAASKSVIGEVKSEYLPDLNVGAQTAYGTINGINGPNFSMPGVSTINGGVVQPTQNWNAAFGSLYATTLNWQFMSFGNHKAKVAVAKGQYQSDEAALEQEKFQLQGNVSGTYLNLLAAQRLELSMEKNLSRATVLDKLIQTRTINGLNPGVDSTIANAELSKARLTLIDAQNYRQAQANQLKVLLGQETSVADLDTSFIVKTPDKVGAEPMTETIQNPVLKYLDSRVKVGQLESNYIKTSKWPKLSLFNLYQSRGSGFGSNYATGSGPVINSSLSAGLDPVRSNYLVGVSAVWSLTDLVRIHKKEVTQQSITAAYKDEFDLQRNTLQEQLSLADERMVNAIKQYNEAPLQLKAANDAFQQKSVLYQNGLATIIDVTTALYNLNRAETDRDIAYNSVWQALLFKAVVSGDMNLFLNQTH